MNKGNDKNTNDNISNAFTSINTHACFLMFSGSGYLMGLFFNHQFIGFAIGALLGLTLDYSLMAIKNSPNDETKKEDQADVIE